MTKKHRHIGYFNDMNDVKYLSTLNVEQIINFMVRGYGDFHEVEPDADTDIDDYRTEHDSHLFEMSADGEYLIRRENGAEDGEGWYLDIYKAVVVEDEFNNVIEYCPHCNRDVELGNEFKVQKCPNCGTYIVPCNLCPLLEKGECVAKCPLSIFAKSLNKDKD